MSVAASPVERAGTQPAIVWVYQAIVFYLVVLRIWFDFAVSPMGDEAYYWIWGQRPQLSYFDHPPLHAWLLGLVSLVFGWTPFAVRALTWVSLAGSLAILWLIAGRTVADGQRWHRFWESAAIFMSLPVIATATVPGVHDHLLVVLCLGAFYCALAFAADLEAGRRRLPLFYGAAVLIGLATLTKYNGALMALGFAVFLVIRPSLRSMWRSPHPYLASLLIAAIQTPVLIWNLGTDFATLSLHFSERMASHWGEMRPLDGLRFIVSMALPLGPLFLIGLVMLPFAKLAGPFEQLNRSLILTLFVVSSAFLAAAASFTMVLLHWNIVAYAAAATMGPVILRSPWLRWPHFALGLYLATVVTWNYAAYPIRVPLFEDGETIRNAGWPEVAAAVRAAQKDHPEAFIASTDYTYAARLAFQLRDPNVHAFGPNALQYALWWDASAHLEQDALIVADPSYSMAVVEPQFRSITALSQVPVQLNGAPVWTFHIYLAKDYLGPAAAH